MDQEQTTVGDESVELASTPGEMAAQLVSKLGKFGAQRFVHRYEDYLWQHAIPAHFENVSDSIAAKMLSLLDVQSFMDSLREAVDKTH